MSFSQEFIQAAQPYLTANEHHPFIQAVFNDQLDTKALHYYIQQDLRYADAETVVQANLVAKSTTIEDQRLFANQLSTQLGTVNELFKSLTENTADSWGNQRYQPIEPVTFIYRSHILAPIAQGSLLDLLAPFEAGNWLYIELGKYLAATGKVQPDNAFYSWVTAVQDPHLAGESGISNRFLQVIDREAANTNAEHLEVIKQQFLRSVLLEWYFWDAAYKQLTWADWERHALGTDGGDLL